MEIIGQFRNALLKTLNKRAVILFRDEYEESAGPFYYLSFLGFVILSGNNKKVMFNNKQCYSDVRMLQKV